MMSTLTPQAVRAFFEAHRVGVVICAVVAALALAVVIALAVALQPGPVVLTFASGFTATCLEPQGDDTIASGAYSAVADFSGMSGLQQQGETLLAVWSQDAPYMPAQPYALTISRTSSGQLVRRFLRAYAGDYIIVLVNADSASAAGNVPLDNTGTWTLFEGDDFLPTGAVFDVEFVGRTPAV